jgi:hypothetical protein
MVAFPKGKRLERRESCHAKKAREKMVKAFEAELKELVRGLLEALMEERAMYLETRLTSANSCCTRELLTLAGPVEASRFPAYGKAISIPGSSPTGSGPP